VPEISQEAEVVEIVDDRRRIRWRRDRPHRRPGWRCISDFHRQLRRPFGLDVDRRVGHLGDVLSTPLPMLAIGAIPSSNGVPNDRASRI
jgi:hypothetical protein